MSGKAEIIPANDTQIAQNSSVFSQYSREQVQLIRSQIAPDATDDELALFLTVCKSRNLDPFSRQIYAIHRNQKSPDGNGWIKKMTIQVSIDGFRALAARTDTYRPGKERVELGQDGTLVSATVSVWKLVAGTWGEFECTAYWEEYAQYGRDKQPSGMWGRMPRTMLLKCAESKALRKGWPDQLSGLYAPEEMDQENNQTSIAQSMEGNGQVGEKHKTPSTLPEVPERFEKVPAELCSRIPGLEQYASIALDELPDVALTTIDVRVSDAAKRAKVEHNLKYMRAFLMDLANEMTRRAREAVQDE